VLALLEERGVRAWLFAGWAEELRGLIPPRPHGDVDLLVRGETFADVDAALGTSGAAPFLRTLELDGVDVELILVREDRAGLYTEFPEGRLDWPEDALAEPRIASAEALRRYRGSR
jgi:hypothetical protein